MSDNVNYQKDGPSWGAFRDGFINLAESVAGFGDTKELALEDLIKREAIENERRKP